ncbi:hypothetical protein CMI40_00960 [Candidatus Pacearchaeota archaeon]|nr:hypothetical protein [Candidatus Pacearchaeota archaeon]
MEIFQNKTYLEEKMINYHEKQSKKEVIPIKSIKKKKTPSKGKYIIKKRKNYCDTKEEVINGKNIKSFYANKQCLDVSILCTRKDWIKNYNNNSNECIKAFDKINKKWGSIFVPGSNRKKLIIGEKYLAPLN